MQSLKLTIISPYHSCIIPQNDTYKAPMGNQSERNTSCVDSLINDKPNSKAYMQRLTHTHTHTQHAAPEMRGYTQIEGQSTQGSDKWTLCICMYIS